MQRVFYLECSLVRVEVFFRLIFESLLGRVELFARFALCLCADLFMHGQPIRQRERSSAYRA